MRREGIQLLGGKGTVTIREGVKAEPGKSTSRESLARAMTKMAERSGEHKAQARKLVRVFFPILT